MYALLVHTLPKNLSHALFALWETLVQLLLFLHSRALEDTIRTKLGRHLAVYALLGTTVM